jgi:isopropylmalate/homocitrate/citramalate synthase
MRFVPIESVE